MFERARAVMAAGIHSIANLLGNDREVRQNRTPTSSRTIAGVGMNPDIAVTISTVWACIRYLSSTVAQLPWHVMREVNGGSDIAASHPVDFMIHTRVSPECSSFQFREQMLSWALRWGNGYAEIQRTTTGVPYALWPLHPERVKVMRRVSTGELYYEVQNDGAPTTEVDAMNMFHLRGLGEGPVGMNVISYAAQSLGWARAAQIFGAAFFGNGATPTSVVINKKGLTPDGLTAQKAEFDALFKGPAKSHRTAHIDNDADIKRIGLNAQESQLIETHQHLVEEICRWFGVPPHKVMHMLRSTYNNIEHQSIEVVVDSVTPWVRRFEDEAQYKFFGVQNRRNYFTKMNINGLMRGDHKSRMEFYRGMVQAGAMSPNEIRALEDLNAIGKEGDIHVMQAQMTTLDRILDPPEPPAPALPAPAGEPAPDPAEDDPAMEFAGTILESLHLLAIENHAAPALSDH